MAAPVVVSRIQNRRGTQSQFESLYPGEYVSAVGATSSGFTVFVASTAGIYQNARPVVSAGVGQFAPGTKVVSVVSTTEFTVDILPLVPLSGGAQVTIPKYDGVGGCPIDEYPNILLPGELALCVDSRKIFMGNANGEYIELSEAFNEGLLLAPLVLNLPPAATWTPIVGMDLDPTPFYTILYDVTDSTSPDWNEVSMTGFSKNGTMKITAVQDFVPVPNPPFPPVTPVGLVDDAVEVRNPSAPYSYTTENISFKAEYDGTAIRILYIHDFPTSLTFTTSTIRWLPF